MHRRKGLEFPRVILVSVHKNEMPKKLPDSALADAASLEDHEKRERCLFYVASTRARDLLAVMGFGEHSPWLMLQ